MTTRIQSFIGGEWLAGPGDQASSENPSDLSDVIGEYRQADAKLADQAIAAASQAAPAWGESTPQKRFDVLDFIGTELIARKDELGQLLAREEGKTLPEAIGETVRAGMIFKFFAGESLRIPGEKLASTRPGVDVEITREPVGVVGAIAPWNFPMAIPAWKTAPALAYGNAVVLKPAEIVVGCGAALAEIISRSGLPKGVFNLIVGRGSVVGNAMLKDKRVNAITFTGSVATGAEVLRQTAARGAKVQLEMGGKNPLVVLADANLDVAVECAIQGAFFSTGQRCTASSRLIVEKSVYEEFIARAVKRLKSLKIGNALTAGVDIGPVASKSQLEQNLKYVDVGRKEGGEVLFGGETLSLDKRGHYMSPALVAAKPGDTISREEIFGPVASVMPADNYEHALQLANDTEFGLCAGVCTTSLKHATHFKRHAQAGMVMVNLPTAGVDPHVPFGGRKGSSYGPREQGRYAV
jgi:acyl-CoA reductase-like NAD-dependent aldehyde dehydrogenase